MSKSKKSIKDLLKPSRSFTIVKAKLKDGICFYKYEVIDGTGIGDTHNVDGTGIAKDELLEAFAAFNIHMAVLDGLFKLSGQEVDDIDKQHGHEFAFLYRVDFFEVKTSKGYETITLKGTKYLELAGGWMDFTMPPITLDNLSSYKWWNELKTAADTAREQVAKYKEGNYTPVKEEVEEKDDKNQGNLFVAGKGEMDEELENAQVK